jgi:hypothetical protein
MLTEMVDPRPVPRADLDSAYEEPSRPWASIFGWLLVALFVALPIIWAFQDAVRADAVARRRMMREAQDMKRILAETEQQRIETARIRKELEEIRRGAR